jgi:hypothetical protein
MSETLVSVNRFALENQTRIGIGAGAVFTMTGVGAPLVSWWISAPVMAVSAFVAAWGLWPLFSSLSFGHLILWRVPLRTAAQICYERCEGTVAGHFFETEFRTEHDRLSILMYSFMGRGVPLFGRQPPSRIARTIPQPAMRNLALVEGTSNLHRIAGSGAAEYLDVYLHRTDLWRHVRYLRNARRPEDI